MHLSRSFQQIINSHRLDRLIDGERAIHAGIDQQAHAHWNFFRRRMVQGWCLAFAAMTVLLLVINYYDFVSLRAQIIAREESQLRQIVSVTGAAVDHMFASTKRQRKRPPARRSGCNSTEVRGHSGLH
jgi:hypothetical protein